MGFEKFEFSIGEKVTFFFAYDGELTTENSTISEIEETGVWVVFDSEPSKEFFIAFVDMNLFLRDGGKYPEGHRALDETTQKFFTQTEVMNMLSLENLAEKVKGLSADQKIVLLGYLIGNLSGDVNFQKTLLDGVELFSGLEFDEDGFPKSQNENLQ